MRKFWMVYRLGHNQGPEKQHVSEEAARFEAKRLAVKHPGETFVVLEAIGTFSTEAIPHMVHHVVPL